MYDYYVRFDKIITADVDYKRFFFSFVVFLYLKLIFYTFVLLINSWLPS